MGHDLLLLCTPDGGGKLRKESDAKASVEKGDDRLERPWAFPPTAGVPHVEPCPMLFTGMYARQIQRGTPRRFNTLLTIHSHRFNSSSLN
jgi:hypothetical protein